MCGPSLPRAPRVELRVAEAPDSRRRRSHHGQGQRCLRRVARDRCSIRRAASTALSQVRGSGWPWAELPFSPGPEGPSPSAPPRKERRFPPSDGRGLPGKRAGITLRGGSPAPVPCPLSPLPVAEVTLKATYTSLPSGSSANKADP